VRKSYLGPITTVFLTLTLAFALSSCSTLSRQKSRSKDRNHSMRGLIQRWIDAEKGISDSDDRRITRRMRKSDTERLTLDASVREKVAKWNWPLNKIKVTSQFGKRGKRFHEGVDLLARTGTPVRAVAAGRVAYSGSRINGYGNMIVIKHPVGLYSVYAHNRKNFVRAGSNVKRGQKIALSGQSGRATGPHLHFEVRTASHAYDPVSLIPINPLKRRESLKRFAKEKAQKNKKIAFKVVPTRNKSKKLNTITAKKTASKKKLKPKANTPKANTKVVRNLKKSDKIKTTQAAPVDQSAESAKKTETQRGDNGKVKFRRSHKPKFKNNSSKKSSTEEYSALEN